VNSEKVVWQLQQQHVCDTTRNLSTASYVSFKDATFEFFC